MTDNSAQIVLTVAERLLDPAAVTAAAPGPAAGSLARGLAGTALLHARLARTDPAFADAACKHWELAAHCALRTGHEGAGTYHSPGGLAASLIIGTSYLPDPERERDAAGRAARWMSARAVDLAERHRHYLAAGGTGTPWNVYDAITGLAGTGRILLAAVRAGHDAEPGLQAALATLTTMVLARDGTRPGWWAPAGLNGSNAQEEPSGTAATGMAHGIAGPLAFLSLASIAGYSVDGQAEAIGQAASWLLHWRIPGQQGWAPHVIGVELDTRSAAPVPGRRDAWCYGTPGIASALALAGQALGVPAFTRAASNAARAMEARSASGWDVEGPTLCHGYAGVLQSTGSPQAASVVTGMFSVRRRFGFQYATHENAMDDPGFLNGACGAALALADCSAIPAPAVPDRWDALLLLS